jgi:uncharacterized protein
MDNYKIKLRERVAEVLRGDNTGHDIYHSDRVYSYARKIVKGENWLDYINDNILYAAAMLHDVGHQKCLKEGDKSREKHVEYSEQYARGILRSMDVPKDEIGRVVACIHLHDDTKPWGKKTPTTVKEILALQDADNLEAMGVLGQLRISFYSYDNKLMFYDPELSKTKNLEESRNKCIIHNMIWHLGLYENLNTGTAKILAKKKDASAKRMIEDLLEELDVSEE